jgi:hypothetical protein
VKRNKTDAADATALLEALRYSEITPVRVKSIEQQAPAVPAPDVLSLDEHTHPRGSIAYAGCAVSSGSPSARARGSVPSRSPVCSPIPAARFSLSCAKRRG